MDYIWVYDANSIPELAVVKDRQHRSRGGSDFRFITQELKGVEHRVIYQMKGNIFSLLFFVLTYLI